MTKRQDLCLQRRSRPEQSDQRQPNQAANISHQPRASPDSTSLASRIEFPTMTGSAVVRLALAEATVPQIATFTGHSLKDVEAILDAHYLGRDIQLAEAAVLKLEKRTKL